jgi:hypothetical protein
MNFRLSLRTEAKSGSILSQRGDASHYFQYFPFHSQLQLFLHMYNRTIAAKTYLPRMEWQRTRFLGLHSSKDT